MSQQLFWIAKKQDGEMLVLTEREALTHFERNNISTRMRLQFLGTTEGLATKRAKEEIKQLIASHRPENYGMLDDGAKNLADHNIRLQHQQEIKEMLDKALAEDVEDAKKQGVKQPRQDLRIHTRGDFGRDKILQAMGGMI